MAGAYGKLGDLLKYASYFLGATAAQENPDTHPCSLTEINEFSWFSPFYDRAIEAHIKIWSQFGEWKNQDDFEALGDILEEMAETIGIEATRKNNDEIYFNIPFRKESMPDGNL